MDKKTINKTLQELKEALNNLSSGEHVRASFTKKIYLNDDQYFGGVKIKEVSDNYLILADLSGQDALIPRNQIDEISFTIDKIYVESPKPERKIILPKDEGKKRTIDVSSFGQG